MTTPFFISRVVFPRPWTFAVVLALASPSCKPHHSSATDAAAHDAAAPAPVATGLPPPDDVAAPPVSALRTASGLASEVLAPGTGTLHPSVNDSVKVNYTGWTTDGKMFDSSVAPMQPGKKAEPITLGLAHVIPGWTEGMQLMVAGEKRRFWIPEALAYNGGQGKPAGMLVFDVELLDFTPGPKPPPDVAAAPADALKTKDGLASKVTQPGSGTAHPQPNDAVKVNFSVWKPDGMLLDDQNKASLRPVSGFFDGWSEGLQLMVVGEKRTFWIPASLAPKPRQGSSQASDITLLVELVDILPGPKTPPDVKAVPKDAIVEKDGLASKILVKGTGTTHPTRENDVTVKYAGWTTDGKLFDSSFSHGEPATLGVGAVIPGWTEALQLMVEGEKRRIWIPAELAYKNKPGAPQGMLVFEVELLKISVPAPKPMRPGGMGGMPPGMAGMPGMGGRPGMGRPGSRPSMPPHP